MSGLLRKINYLPIWRSCLSVWGARMFHPSGDRWLYLWLHRLGLMGGLERKTIEYLLRPGMSVLDVGGNIGLYTVLFSQLVGETGQVVTIEPIEELRDSLQKSIAANQIKNVAVLSFAAGSASGFVKLNRDALNSGNNWISTAVEEKSSVEVPAHRLDALDWDRPLDFVKIDVQGWETEVLKGMSGLILTRCRPIILCEISKASLIAAGSSVPELGQLLRDYRYEMYMPRKSSKGIELERLDLSALVEKSNRVLYFDIIALPVSP